MTILVVVAHPDDEVLGCGASIAKWSDAGEEVHVLIMAEGETSRDINRNVKAKRVEISLLERSAKRAGKVLGVSSVKLFGFPDNRMDSLDRLDVIKVVEREINRLQPHTVVTHYCNDLNIDHRVVYEAVITACRPQPESTVRCLLSFEVPSSTEWQIPGASIPFQPNWFENVEVTIEKKLEALELYQSEMRTWPHARSLQNIEHLARYRGSSVGCEAAEAFMLLRTII
ncbi:PIG-L family deacetylase [bacterium]|jgi:LmbE family N-acetylglucosaminyl deacetylase|nr:PIG-L family deacetylase [bacterium]